MRRPTRLDATVALASSVVVLLVAGGVAVAAIPDAAGVIHGCRNRNTGALRVINFPNQQCTSKESTLNWNQVGPEGISGYTTHTEEEGIPAATGPDPLATIYHPDADCPAGKMPISAGWEAFNVNGPVAPTFVADRAVGTTWRWGVVPTGLPFTFKMTITCATAN